MKIAHSFVSQKADGADTSLVRPSNWNADHVIGLSPSGGNDSPQIQAALDAISSYGTVLLGAGIFQIGTTINLPSHTSKNASIRGMGRNITRLNLTANTNMFSTGSTAWTGEMSDFGAYGAPSGLPSNVGRFFGGHPRLATFKNLVVAYFDGDAFNIAKAAAVAADLETTIENSNITNNTGYGIFLSNTSTVSGMRIVNSWISNDDAAIAGVVALVIINGNSLGAGASWGGGVLELYGSSHNVIITNNYIDVYSAFAVNLSGAGVSDNFVVEGNTIIIEVGAHTGSPVITISPTDFQSSSIVNNSVWLGENRTNLLRIGGGSTTLRNVRIWPNVAYTGAFSFTEATIYPVLSAAEDANLISYDQTVRSTTLDLSGAASDVVVYQAQAAAQIVGYSVFYTEASSADAGVVVRIGRYQNGVALDDDYFDTVTSEASKALGYSKYYQTADLTNVVIAKGDTVTVGTAGGKTGAGEVTIVLRIAEGT